MENRKKQRQERESEESHLSYLVITTDHGSPAEMIEFVSPSGHYYFQQGQLVKTEPLSVSYLATVKKVLTAITEKGSSGLVDGSYLIQYHGKLPDVKI